MAKNLEDNIQDASGQPDFKFFNELYAKYYKGFVRFAQSYVGDHAAAEDFVAEAFMAYWNNRDNVAPDSNIRAYIMTILKNKCLNHLRHEGLKDKNLRRMNNDSIWELELRISTLEACDPQEIFSSEIQALVDGTVQSLPRKTLEVFVMSRYQNKSNREIAEYLGISVKGVEFHITKALSILKEQLKDYLPALIFIYFAGN